jgi:hypothetical protein
MTELIRGAWTADRITLAPPARKTASNVVVKLASRSCSTDDQEGKTHNRSMVLWPFPARRLAVSHAFKCLEAS